MNRIVVSFEDITRLAEIKVCSDTYKPEQMFAKVLAIVQINEYNSR